MAKTISVTTYKWIVVLALLLPPACRAQNADIDLLKSINRHRNKSLDGTMGAFTNSVYPVAAIVPITELVIGYKTHDSTLIRHGYTSIAGVGINFIVTFGLKYAVNRTRPYVTYPALQPYQHDKDPSFPSGHTSFAFNTVTSLVQICPRWYVVVPAYAWATTVAYTRMDLGMHYPSDVLAGAIIGAGTSLLAVKGNEWLHHRKKKKAIVNN